MGDSQQGRSVLWNPDSEVPHRRAHEGFVISISVQVSAERERPAVRWTHDPVFKTNYFN